MFKLVIECSKDINGLKINFSDGTSAVTEKIKNDEEFKNEQIENEDKNDLTNWKSCENTNTREVVKPIELPSVVDRPPMIDDNLDNLDF